MRRGGLKGVQRLYGQQLVMITVNVCVCVLELSLVQILIIPVLFWHPSYLLFVESSKA